MTFRIEIERDDCMSSGKCVANHPDVFDFDDEELAVCTPEAGSASDDVKLHAARSCPSGAILLFTDDGAPVAT